LQHYVLPPFLIASICCAAFLIGFPQTVHLMFSKNCGSQHRLLSHRIISIWPHASHRVPPTKVWLPQNGQAVMSVLPHPEHTASPRLMGLRQVGQW
jgi:hypothetical protein